MHEEMSNETISQQTAQRVLREHGVMIDPEDTRSEVEVAQAFGFLPLQAAGLEKPEE